MRTLTALACAAALAAGIATSMAQTSNVYSLNVVGYYNVAMNANQFYLIANQLNTTNMALDALIPNPSDGFNFYKYNSGWTLWQWSNDDNSWDYGPTPYPILTPGDAAMVSAQQATTLTFVGEVLQGTLTVPIPTDNIYHARSSIVPQAGGLSTDLGYHPDDGDSVYRYNNGWSFSQWSNDDNSWDYSGEPHPGVGEGLMFQLPHGSSGNWVRNFTVQ